VRSNEAERQRRRRLALLGAWVAVIAIAVVAIGESGESGATRRRMHSSNAMAPSSTEGQIHRAAVLQENAAANREIKRLVALALPIFCAGRHGHDIAFTFDDGPGPYTYLALKKLRQAGQRATFFIVGRNIPLYPGWLRRELKLAALGDHTYTHPPLTALPGVEVRSELLRTAQAVEANAGVRVDLFRPPYELHNAVVDQIAHRLGLLEILWTVDSRDSLGADWGQIIKNVEAGVHPGSIVLMHENRGQTIRALTTLLPWLHQHHLHSVTIPELLASDPPSPAQVRLGAAGCRGTSKPVAGSGG
jgi:peptidoglycan/xylan/chitin deacetylase (PgdA/CDA1 family)